MTSLLQYRDFEPGQLDEFRRFQRRAFDVLERVAATLCEGESERAVAARLHRAFAEQGVRSYFHVPVALFGERTAYPGDFGSLEARATERTLGPGEPVILDAAPFFGSTLVDVSLAVPRDGGEASLAACDALLRRLRDLVLARARARRPMRETAREVAAAIDEAGFENCHRKHIASVLAHRVVRARPRWLAERRIWGLSPVPVGWFFWRSFRSLRGAPALTPNWNHSRQSDCAPQPGLWAVEPHVARGGFGAKFEELLVVTEDSAHYLDDDLPHHRRWAAVA